MEHEQVCNKSERERKKKIENRMAWKNEWQHRDVNFKREREKKTNRNDADDDERKPRERCGGWEREREVRGAEMKRKIGPDAKGTYHSVLEKET